MHKLSEHHNKTVIRTDNVSDNGKGQVDQGGGLEKIAICQKNAAGGVFINLYQKLTVRYSMMPVLQIIFIFSKLPLFQVPVKIVQSFQTNLLFVQAVKMNMVFVNYL